METSLTGTAPGSTKDETKLPVTATTTAAVPISDKPTHGAGTNASSVTMPESSSTSSSITKAPAAAGAPVVSTTTHKNNDSNTAVATTTADTPKAAPAPAVLPSIAPKARRPSSDTASTPKPPPAPTSGTPSSVAGDGNSLEARVMDEIVQLMESGKIKNKQEELPNICIMINDYAALKEKTTKLKSLLGRSAKVQRETKIDLEAANKRLEHALREVDRLTAKIDHLSKRPTHMELLADFEANFDRAILSVGRQQQQQIGGEDTSPMQSASAHITTMENNNRQIMGGQQQQQQQQQHHASLQPWANNSSDNLVDNMLMQELADCRKRIEKLESLNSALVHRSAKYENDYKNVCKARDDNLQKVTNLELQLRMAQMEVDNAKRAYEEKNTSLEEMQMEIDLLSRASMDANKRAAHGEAVINSIQMDKQHIAKLEAQVIALEEWALASAEAKALSVDRANQLELQLRKYEMKEASTGSGATANTSNTATGGDTTTERIICVKKGSLVIGASEVGHYCVELLDEHKRQLTINDKCILKWKFETLGSDLTTNFSILSGKCQTKQEQKNAQPLFKPRELTNGTGEVAESPFALQNACTLLWSNEKSWIRPRTITYTVEIVAVREY